MALRSANTLGLDIGTTGMRAVEVSWRSGAPVVERWGGLDFDADVKDWSTANLSDMSEQLRTLVVECGFHSKIVAHSVSGKAVVPQYFNFPQLMPEDVPDAVRIEVESTLPFESEEALVSYILFPAQRIDPGKVRTHGMAVATDSAFVERRLDMIRHAGLEPFCVETDATACANAYITTQDILKRKGTTAVLNVGQRDTNLVLVGDADTLLMRDMPWGGSLLNRAITERLSITEVEAIRLKELHWRKDPAGKALDECLEDVLQKSAGDFLMRLRDTMRYWVGERLVPAVERVFLTGGGSQVRGLTELLSSTLSVGVEHVAPIKTESSEMLGDHRLSVAFGLALRRF